MIANYEIIDFAKYQFTSFFDKNPMFWFNDKNAIISNISLSNNFQFNWNYAANIWKLCLKIAIFQ